MARNYSNEVVGHVGLKLLPSLAAGGPLITVWAIIAVIICVVTGILQGYAALFGSAEKLDLYLRGTLAGLMLLPIMLPSLALLPIVSKAIGDRWQPTFRKTKIFALLLAGTCVVLTAVSFANGSHIWSQLAYHQLHVGEDRLALMAWSCPTEAPKAARDPKSKYHVEQCRPYLDEAVVTDLCWQEYRTMKPLAWGYCALNRVDITGADWPTEGRPAEGHWDRTTIKPHWVPPYATQDQMRAVLIKKGLAPL